MEWIERKWKRKNKGEVKCRSYLQLYTLDACRPSLPCLDYSGTRASSHMSEGKLHHKDLRNVEICTTWLTVEVGAPR